MRHLLCLLALTLSAGFPASDYQGVMNVGDYSFKLIKNFTVHKPGYTLMQSASSMIITSFEAAPVVGKSAVYTLDLASSTVTKIPKSDSIDWPNVPVAVDSSVFGFDALLIGSGFLVPTHGHGGMWILENSDNPTQLKAPVKISQPSVSPHGADWFYHQGTLIDMNGDGKLDVLTARCHYDAIPTPWAGKKEGVLIWLEQPQSDPLSGQPWKEHVLAPGPDFLFSPKPGNSLEDFGVAAAEYIDQQLSYYFLRNGSVASKVVDSQLGPGFGVEWGDVNNDGVMDLLASNHVNQNGSVTAYSWEGDLQEATVTKHVLATGFSAVSTMTGTASPGDAMLFHPHPASAGKPWVFVSGDNGNAIFALIPKSSEAGSWEYEKVLLAEIGADVGRVSIVDVDGDGYMELLVPGYDSDTVAMFGFGPK